MDALDLSDDFELEKPSEAPQDIATWDDSQHMDRLLAGLQDQPHDEFVASGDDVDAGRRRKSTHNRRANGSRTSRFRLSSQAGQPRRKKSIVRTMLMTVLGGVMAVPLAGYALLWLKGPRSRFPRSGQVFAEGDAAGVVSQTIRRQLAGGPRFRRKVEDDAGRACDAKHRRSAADERRPRSKPRSPSRSTPRKPTRRRTSASVPPLPLRRSRPLNRPRLTRRLPRR